MEETMGFDIGSLLGGGIGGLFNFLGTESTNQNQMAMLQQQEAYQTQMSNTAYQRASADMKAAGLNPMMMFGSGGAASTPSAPGVAPPQSPLKGVGESIQHMFDMAVSSKTVDRMAEEISNLKAAKLQTEAQTLSEKARPAQIQQAVKESAARTENIDTESQLMQMRKIVMTPDYLKSANIADLYDDPMFVRAVKAGAWTEAGAKPITDIAGAAASAIPGVAILRKALGNSAKYESQGLSPSQVRNLYDKFESMRGR